MKFKRNLLSSIPHLSFLLMTVLTVGLLTAVLAGSALASEHVIYTFQGGNDGIGSNDLVADQAGNLYGTTFNGGGSGGAGTVYELSPPAQLGGTWTETILYSFSYTQLTSGIGPLAGLAMVRRATCTARRGLAVRRALG